MKQPRFSQQAVNLAHKMRAQKPRPSHPQIARAIYKQLKEDVSARTVADWVQFNKRLPDEATKAEIAASAQ